MLITPCVPSVSPSPRRYVYIGELLPRARRTWWGSDLDMVRIADATGIQRDERMAVLSQEVRDTLHLEIFTAYKEMG
jgi:hypothetical protein